MDPNEVLGRAQQAATEILEAEASGCTVLAIEDAVALAEAFVNLSDWLRNGGFLPDEWARRRRG